MFLNSKFLHFSPSIYSHILKYLNSLIEDKDRNSQFTPTSPKISKATFLTLHDLRFSQGLNRRVSLSSKPSSNAGLEGNLPLKSPENLKASCLRRMCFT